MLPNKLRCAELIHTYVVKSGNMQHKATAMHSKVLDDALKVKSNIRTETESNS